MKILIIANNSAGLYIFRGLLLSELVEKGNSVVAATPFDDRVEDLKSIGVRLIETHLDRRTVNPIKDMRLLSNYGKIVKTERPDFIITYTIKPNVYGGMIARINKVPYAANITGLGTAFENKGMIKKVALLLNRVALREAKVVFFENTANRDYFVKEKIIEESQATVLNGAGVDLSKFTLKSYPKEPPFRFLFIGRVMREKGIDELLQVIQRLNDDGNNCILDIVGGLEENYLQIIQHYSLGGYVEYYGVQTDVRPFIEKSHCFVLPSWHEGMANTNLECAATGRPIITSDIPGCREAVIDGKTGLLCQRRNAKDLYDCMKKMMSISHGEREQMGKDARALMESVFDKRIVVSNTIKALFEEKIKE